MVDLHSSCQSCGVRFAYDLFAVNVYPDGRVCLSILNDDDEMGGQWKPGLGLKDVSGHYANAQLQTKTKKRKKTSCSTRACEVFGYFWFAMILMART